ncbi:MAG: ABC transporter ATP-binding protein, partial [Candidatus Aenigmarchaeota archaeon]|nr:ABC transporter ATP-binding protein [Candidatus Aenigmarchaeota archaeon]
MYAIETKNLKKDFKDGKETVHAVRGIDLRVEKNQVYGLLGPNGAGKTTTIFMLSTLLLPTSGSAKVLGYDAVKEKNVVRGKVGLCVGATEFYWIMKPAEILDYYARLYGIPKDERKERAKKLMEELDINWYADKTFGQMSTGMRQKLAFAKSLINNPEVLFLDEPTIGLDVEAAISVRKYILKLVKERGMTVILTSHHL